MPTPPDRPSRRDRHGRGVRTTAHPWNGATRFEQLLHDAITSLEPHPAGSLADVHFAIEDIPDLDHLDPTRGESIPLAQNAPIPGSGRTKITIFRHPITIRCADGAELAALILDVVIEQLAEVWGVEPEEIDERYGESD